MPRPDVRAVCVDPDGLAVAALERVDFADAHAVRIDPGLPREPAWWLDRLLTDLPGWLRLALRARDAAVRPFGLQGGDMGRLPVFADAPAERVVGLDDAHLDFRIGVHVSDGPRPELRLTTTVRFRSRLGRLYFLPVRPVHARLVVPAMLRRAGRVAA